MVNHILKRIKPAQPVSSPGRPLCSPADAALRLFLAGCSLPLVKHPADEAKISEQFKERLMLAVTEVNQCQMCSYGHTRMALETGMSSDEIRQLLAGEKSDTPDDELPAVMFAQHYAESNGKPESSAWIRIIEEYGPRSRTILAALRTIMAGNAFGIPMGSLKGRFSGNADPRSTPGYEIIMMLTAAAALPPALAGALICALTGWQPPLHCSQTETITAAG